MQSIVIALLSFFIISCSTTVVDPYHEAEFEKIVNEFEETCDVKVRSSVMFVDELEGKAIGVCYMGRFAVFIDRLYWMTASTPEERFTLIMHELGHCELFRPHTEEMKVFKIEGENHVMPKSILYPYVFPIPDYPDIKDYYMKELCFGD